MATITELTSEEVLAIKSRLARGEYQHRIASLLSCLSRRPRPSMCFLATLIPLGSRWARQLAGTASRLSLMALEHHKIAAE